MTRPRPRLKNEAIPRKKKHRTIPVIKQVGFHIPTAKLTKAEVKDATQRFTHNFYTEAMCRKCEYKAERHSEVCDDCEGFVSTTVLARTEMVSDRGEFLRIPYGGKPELIKWMKRHNLTPKKVYNQTVDNKPIDKFRFVRKPWDYQNAAVMDFIAKETGVIDSKPRTGKTVMGAIVVRRLGQKTLILAHQKEWLDNFMATFIGNEDEPAFTDIDPSRIGYAKKLADFERLDICLATFQQFYNPRGQKLLNKIVHMFPLVIVDECHFAPAPESAKIMAKMRSRYRLGLSGSTDRKDGRYIIFHQQVGGIVHTTEATALSPKVRPIVTGQSFTIYKRHGAAFVNMLKQIERNKARRKIIVDTAIRQAARGHFVLIPVNFTETIDYLVKEINAKSDEPIARPFFGGLNKFRRKENLVDARDYQYKIMVANRALISTGVNIPRASCLIDRVTPTSNIPKATQRFSRILTPHPDKPDPLIILLLDGGIPKGMARNEFYNCLIKDFDVQISDRNWKVFKTFFADDSAKPGQSPEDY